MLKNWLFYYLRSYIKPHRLAVSSLLLCLFCFFFLPSVWKTWRTLLSLVCMGKFCSTWIIKPVKISLKLKILHNIFLWESQHVMSSAAGKLSPVPAVIVHPEIALGCSFQLIVRSLGWSHDPCNSTHNLILSVQSYANSGNAFLEQFSSSSKSRLEVMCSLSQWENEE